MSVDMLVGPIDSLDLYCRWTNFYDLLIAWSYNVGGQYW